MQHWKTRSHFRYYAVVKDLIRRSHGDSILDVGGWDTPVVLARTFARRVIVDIRPIELQRPNVEYHRQDFMEWKGGEFDLVLCLQVLEHLEHHVVASFARKLFCVGKKVIISVPYRWDRSFVASHKHDPVDEHKLCVWTERKPDWSQIVDDDLPRLVCMYHNNRI